VKPRKLVPTNKSIFTVLTGKKSYMRKQTQKQKS